MVGVNNNGNHKIYITHLNPTPIRWVFYFTRYLSYMKIVISESQYTNLFGVYNEKNSNLIYKMWNDGMDFYEISELTGLRESQVIYLLKDNKISISCDLAYILIQILYKTSLINKGFNFNNGQMELVTNWDSFGGLIAFEYDDKDYKLMGMATPYWDGNCSTPVDGSYFEDKETGQYIDVYDNSGIRTDYTPSKFNSIQELIDFLNNEYPTQLIKPIRELIEYYKNNI